MASHQAGEKPGAAHRGWGSKKSAQAHLRNRLHKGEWGTFRKPGCAVQNEAQNEVQNAVIADGKAMWDCCQKASEGPCFCCRTARLDASRAMKSKELTGVGYPSATRLLYDRFGRGAIDCSES